MAESKTTTNHDEIRKWAEDRGGVPAVIKSTDQGGGGMLRIHFPGRGDDEAFEEISWDDFFETFEDHDLALLYQDETSGHETSRFYKLVNREHA